MSSAEFSEWMEFYQLEPFGREADFQGYALTAATIVNRSLQKGEKAVKVDDFMPKDPPPPQTTDQMLQFARMLTIGLGGTIEGE